MDLIIKVAGIFEFVRVITQRSHVFVHELFVAVQFPLPPCLIGRTFRLMLRLWHKSRAIQSASGISAILSKKIWVLNEKRTRWLRKYWTEQVRHSQISAWTSWRGRPEGWRVRAR